LRQLIIGAAIAATILACNKDKAGDGAAESGGDPFADCSGDNAKLCLSAGVKFQTGEGVEANAKQALELFNKVCKGGEVKGCTLAAHLYRKGADGVEKDEAKALTMYEDACNKDSEPNACFHAGNAYGIEQLGAKKDPQKSYDYLKKSCDGGNKDACNFAEMLKNTLDNMPDKLAGRCDKGEAKACADLAFQYWKGNKGVEKKDPAKAREYFGKACELKSGDGCTGLGMTYEKTETPDIAKAVEAYEKGCAAGSKLSCKVGGKHYFDGKAVKQDYAKAKDMSDKACTLGNMDGCFLMGVLYKRGFGVKADPAKSQTYLKKACDGGLKSVCKFVGK